MLRAQTLPQSTQDRQTIAQLQYQLSQPGVTAQDRVRIQERITQLQYQINTRPPIQAPGATPLPPQSYPIYPVFYNQKAPDVPIEPSHYGYGSCAADREMIEYLQDQLKDPNLTQQERTYIPNKIKDLEHDMKVRRC